MSTTNKCVVIQHYTNYRLSIKYYLYASESLNQTQLEEALVLYLITFQSVSFIAEPAIIEAQLNNNIDTIIATVAFTIKLSLTMTEINLIENRFRGITWNMKIDNNFIQANVKQNLTSENPSKLTVLKVGRWSPPYNIEYIMNELPDTNFSYIESVLYFSDICEEFNVDFKTIKAVKTVVHLGNHSCISNVANFNDRDGFVDLTTYVTYSCFSISVVALTIMIILNRRIRKVKSIPISNLENLAVSIIAANFFFMFGIGANDIQSVCYVIGIVLHYIWLLEFAFMSTSVLFIVINLLQLKSNMAHRPTRSMRYRMFISLFGLLSPSLLVIPAVIVDVLGKDELSPGYNGEVCFPTKYPGNMIFFLGPVFLSITINFISLVLFIGYIVMTSSSIGNVTKSSTYSHAFVFLRITIVSGIFWINGIVATFYENEIFNYIFILLCGLQGLFISLASLTSTAMKEIKKI
ncbi:unnamed protein product [Mytilus coruscus]|nr:unnamed protein product [Mytilus coruscus]